MCAPDGDSDREHSWDRLSSAEESLSKSRGRRGFLGEGTFFISSPRNAQPSFWLDSPLKASRTVAGLPAAPALPWSTEIEPYTEQQESGVVFCRCSAKSRAEGTEPFPADLPLLWEWHWDVGVQLGGTRGAAPAPARRGSGL